MVQLNPAKWGKKKKEEKKPTKKSRLRVMSLKESTDKLKKDAGKVWGGIKKAGTKVKQGAEWARKQRVTIPTAASRKAKKAEAAKPKKPSTAKSRARAANVAIHGEKAISGLEAKNKDFQKMKKGGLSKADFIKKYPNSQTAKKAKGRR